MSHHFDNNNRYQIIYPYTSDRIYVEPDINHGAYRCYNELKDRDIKTYIFIVHEIDTAAIYYFNIPKFRDYHNQQDFGNTNTNTIPSGSFPALTKPPTNIPHGIIEGINTQNPSLVDAVSIHSASQNVSSKQLVVPGLSQDTSLPNSVVLATAPTLTLPISPNNLPTIPLIPTEPEKVIPTHTFQLIQPTDKFDKLKQDEIIMRLNNVEYQLDIIKKNFNQAKKNEEEDNCIIL